MRDRYPLVINSSIYSIDLRQPVLVYDLLLAVVLKNMKSLRTGTENRRFFSDCFVKPHHFLKVFEINGTNQRFFDSELFFSKNQNWWLSDFGTFKDTEPAVLSTFKELNNTL
jgi:hypothetical protein